MRLPAPLAFYLLVFICRSMQVCMFTGRMCAEQDVTLSPHVALPLIATAEKACRTTPHKIRLSPLKVVAPLPLWDPINTQIAATSFSHLPIPG